MWLYESLWGFGKPQESIEAELSLIFLTGHSVWNVLVNFHSLTTVATVYLKALFWDLSSFHCILLGWAHSFFYSDLIIIYMLMTPNCSYPSRQHHRFNWQNTSLSGKKARLSRMSCRMTHCHSGQSMQAASGSSLTLLAIYWQRQHHKRSSSAVCGMLTQGRRNRMTRSLEMRVCLKLKARFWMAKRVCGSVQFSSLWLHARSKSLRFTSVQYGVCWY